ncbi:hypothetical protein GUITHDRAFT_156026 [Guillardia theta CCMP2712]|uniref:Uncharacterized protein n=1 Tax=Guillardia theta (strain CCMP2712) TaxID=905079 RepID=L1IC16_GUITC|nr:hypothetical protein GUITHDRAFT_156026 [Guillardia theta CCMP2712]EKX33474.1 hypothetical protein GUITHDRAFT_156026 [Guillardia theta CCMP2712]|eukprot:XP_005820454.1 hypothetical protein GUITHDRAFT_156026 [Guillardia theta CCMP2712]
MLTGMYRQSLAAVQLQPLAEACWSLGQKGFVTIDGRKFTAVHVSIAKSSLPCQSFSACAMIAEEGNSHRDLISTQ